MSEQMLESYANRLGVYDAETLEKSKELLRLIELRKANFTIAAKIALSIHCGAILCGTEIDAKDVAKSSALREKNYIKQKALSEKLLDLDKKWTLDEMCSKFDMNEALKNDASRLLKKYKKKKPLLEGTDHPSFLAMAIYQSFKFRKMKVTSIKAKLVQFSRLSNKTWKALEEEWNNWIEKDSPLASQGKRNETSENGLDAKDAMVTKETESIDCNVTQKIHEEIPYDEWHENMIKKAKTILKT